MPIYRVLEPRLGGLHMREWRRRVLHTVALLLLVLIACEIGMIALDTSSHALPDKMFRGLWNALNLVTTLGDFTSLDQREKVFMIATMVAFLIIGGYALSSMTGFLSSDAVITLRENRKMERMLDHLANHVIVSLGYLVVQGDAGVDDAALDYAKIGQAKALVVTTEDPDRKLSITLMISQENRRRRH